MKKVFFVLMLSLLFITGCTDKSGLKFKNEYEKYNGEYSNMSISENNIVKYSNKIEITELVLNKKSGVVYLGNPQSNESRNTITKLLQAADSTDLQEILYLNVKDITEEKEIYKYLGDKAKDITIPVVAFIVDGEIVATNQNVSENDMLDNFTTNIHKVLKDVCDENC